MQEKTRKLREKFASEFDSDDKGDSSKEPQNGILEGVTIWVDGLTKPGREELREIVGKHGGEFEVYCTGKVTHVIAEKLATATRLRLGKMESGRKRIWVVRPSWVVESVKKGIRLDEGDFKVEGMGDPRVKSINKFFKKKN